MKLGSYIGSYGISCGIMVDGKWLDIPRGLKILNFGETAFTLKRFLENQQNYLSVLKRLLENYQEHPADFADVIFDIGECKFLPPISENPRLFTQRGNSCLFSRAVKLKMPCNPVFEQRFPHIIEGHQSTFVIPAGFDGGWNPELIAVIGTGGKNISPEEVYNHILGYTLMIDHAGNIEGLMNDWQVKQEERVMWDDFFFSGFFGNVIAPHPVGPWITTSDELQDPHHIWISASEKDRVVEKVHSSAVLFDFKETISFMSQFITLKPGDMISTGSIGYDGYPYWDNYPDGSYLEVAAEGIGSLRLNLVDERGN